MKIVMTGGHHSSALPVIAELRTKLGADKAEIFWFGHRHTLKGDKNDTLEYKEITSLKIPFYELHAGKFYRTFDPIRLLKIPFGFFQALWLLIKIRPQVVMSFGGYLAVPVALAAWVLGIPVVTHEQALVAGYANKLIAKVSSKVLLSWPQLTDQFDKSKSVFVGLPLRSQIFSSSSNFFEINRDLPTIYITAGKTGSHKINQVVLLALESLLKKCNVIHQTGDYSVFSDFEDLEKKYLEVKNSVPGKYFAKKFTFDSEIGEIFAKSKLVVSRAGAHICAEIVALKKQAVLIPIPWVSHNEQNINAEFVRNMGLCEILPEANLTVESLLIAISNGLAKPTEYFEPNVEEYKHIPEKICEQIISAAK